MLAFQRDSNSWKPEEQSEATGGSSFPRCLNTSWLTLEGEQHLKILAVKWGFPAKPPEHVKCFPTTMKTPPLKPSLDRLAEALRGGGRVIFQHQQRPVAARGLPGGGRHQLETFELECAGSLKRFSSQG